MREVILCKYGEIILKGANRRYFENMLDRELIRRAKGCGSFEIYHAQSTVYIEPQDESADIDAMLREACHVFGVVSVSRAAVCEKTMESILECAKAYVPAFLAGKRTFKVEAKRADKTFLLKSPEISSETGGAILDVCPDIRVDVNAPDVTVRVEVREHAAYVHAGSYQGAGGMPVGSNGRALLLLSGGIDSPVAGFMMAKRGVTLHALYFESYPYTSVQAREKVFSLAGILCDYCDKIKVHVISLTEIQEELRRKCEEDYFTLLLRRFMMALAERCAREFECQALITGESLGQVASQTMEALTVTDKMVDMPVFRPCIGLDKEEIVKISRAIGTYDTSILPYEDCCTVFTPRHPRTKPVLEKVVREQEKVDFAGLCERAYASMFTEVTEKKQTV